MINSFFQYTIINRKTLRLPIICGWVVLFGICAIAQKTSTVKNADGLKTWKITSSRSGGIAGMIQGYTLDSGGHYNELSRAKKVIRKIEPATLREISKLILELNLPGAKMKTVKGLGIYDGIYESFTITLGSKDYKIEGSSFYREKLTALSAEQQKTYRKLQELLRNIETVPSNANLINQIKPPPIVTGKIWTVRVWKKKSAIKYDSQRKLEYFVMEKVALWTGQLIRRGQSSVFDAVWRNVLTGEETSDTIELADAVRERVILRRDGEAKADLHKIFRGSYEKEKPTIILGNAESSGLNWEATIEMSASSKIDDGDIVQTKLPIAPSNFTAPLNPANQRMVFRLIMVY